MCFLSFKVTDFIKTIYFDIFYKYTPLFWKIQILCLLFFTVKKIF